MAGNWQGLFTTSTAALGVVLYLGVITSALAFLVFNRGMEIIVVSRAAINQLLFPAVTVLLSYFLGGVS